jgi:spore maturation protein SpmB
MSAIIMNMAANALGLTNAATPLGIRAMEELDKINPRKGTATNAMCTFMAINTSSVALLPLGVINIRATAGARNPAIILLPTLFATLCSTIVAIIAVKLMQSKEPPPLIDTSTEMTSPDEEKAENESAGELTKPGIAGQVLFGLLIVLFFGAVIYRLFINGVPDFTSTAFLMKISHWLMPFLMCLFLLYSYFKGAKVYESLTEGAKSGFTIAVRIIPFLVAIFVAIGMFRASGALDILSWLVSPLTSLIGMPAEALPVALIRPLSGSGSFGIMAEIVNNAPDSFVATLVSTMQGSTETTFYVLAVYFGSVRITNTRHAVPASLCADAAGVIAAVTICRLVF